MAWLSGYNYRKSITLSRASGAVSNYQMKLLLGESSGATGEDVDCGGYCLSTFNDLRFTKADGTTLLDYWIESISGTTPNQLATVWIEFDSIGTGATTFYMYYGKADAPAVSNGANTFIVFDDFERGANGDPIGGSWTEVTAHVNISTEQKYGGSRSAKILGSSSGNAQATIPVAASDNVAMQMRVYKEDAAVFIPISYGNGSKRPIVRISTGEKVEYHNGTSYIDTGASFASWDVLEVRNIVFATGKFDIAVNGTTIKSDADMYSDSISNGVNRIYGDSTADRDSWIDNFLVRNWRSTEPAWGSWGAMEEWAGITTETATATATFDGDSLRDSTSESAEATDTFGRNFEVERSISESAEATDSMEALHLVDSISESASASGLMEADDLIRKKIKFPNLQGKHLSLKFESATDGSFAIYYLRHKMFKTRELCSDQKHPNTQGSHIGLKLSNSGTDAFTLMYVSEEMQLVTT